MQPIRTGAMLRILGAALVAAATTALALTAPVLAQAFPDKPITVIVPSAAGGPADVSARLIGERMSALLGQQLVIEAVPGAGGTIGMARVARAAPDGYTLMVHQNGFAITPTLYEKLSFDTAKDFTTVGLVNQSYVILVGREDLPAKTFAELKAWMLGPGKPAKYAHPGAGTLGHLQTLMLVKALGVEASVISYRGIAPAVNDLLGKHIDLANVGAAVASRHIAAGKLKGYAVGATKRIAGLPDVPTFGEVGSKELERPFWHALFAPAATPQPVVAKLYLSLRKALSNESVRERYRGMGVEIIDMSQSEFDAYVRADFDKWRRVAREGNIVVE